MKLVDKYTKKFDHMTMTSTLKQDMAHALLYAFADQIEAQLGDWVEVECTGDKLLIEDEKQQQFLLNYHPTTQEIWYASPRTGAYHFAYNETHKRWLSTRHEELDIFQCLENDLGEATGQSLQLM